MTNQEFITAIAGYVKKYAAGYGIRVHSAIIAQAINESGWGKSKLAANYHNYFGMKCGSSWTGKSVNLATQEEYSPGTLTTIRDNFRVYDSMDEGVKGYFEFINTSRYANLKGITDPRTYLETIRADGYATSSTYVENNMKLVDQYNLTKYDEGGESMTEMELRQKVVKWLEQYLGIKEGSAKHKEILKTFNDSGLCTRHTMTVNDDWCATAVAAAFIGAGLAKIFPCVECSCSKMIELAKKAGIWVENDAYVPKVGDVIIYSWKDSGKGECTTGSDHTGVVCSVGNSTQKIIEGNKSDTVTYRNFGINARYTRGYITPDYASMASGGAGSSPSSGDTGSSSGSGTLNKTVQWTGMVTASELSVRTWAGTENKTCSFSPLEKGTEVGVCDSVKADDGSIWYYIKYNDRYGFVHSDYVKKKGSSSASGGSSTSGSSTSKTVDYAKSYDKALAGTYEVTASDGLNLRTGAGTGKTKITTMPKKARCQCYGYYTSVGGVKWLLLVYNGKQGFASSQYLRKV